MLRRWSRVVVLVLCLCLCLQVATARTPRGLIRRQDTRPAESVPAPTPTPEGDNPDGEDQGSKDEGGEGDAKTTGEKGAEPTKTGDEEKPTETEAEKTAVPTLMDGQDSTDVLNYTIPEGQLPIQPRLTPAFGVGGTLLLITGAVYAVVGIKNAWLHTFFSAVYLAALATTVLIVYVMPVPVSDPVQGAYLVAIAMTGIVLGIGATIFKEITEGLGCMLGGFCVSMWLLTLTAGGLLPQAAPKVILISAFTVGCFCLYFSHYTRDYALIVLISFAGATVTVLGIDCFSRAGLKEFWAYLWNLNENLFPLGTVTYPVTKGIRVETAAIIILCLAGIVSQLKLWKVIQEKRAKKAAEKAEDERNLHIEEEAVGRQVEAANTRDRRAWERVYGDGEDDGHAPEEATAVGSGDSGVGDMESEKRMRHMSGMSTRAHSQDGVVIEMAEMASPPQVPPKSPTPGGLMVVEESQEGMVTVRVAKDDYPRAPESPLIKDPEERAWIMGADGDVRSVTRQSLRPQSSVSRAMTTSPAPPEVVPLPFQIAEDEATERGTLGDRSSLAGTFADDEDGRGSRRNSMARRLSQGSMNLLRSLSQRSKGRELTREKGHESSEDLVTPQAISRASRRDDDNQSLAVTFDNESLHGSLDGGEKTPRETKGMYLELKLGNNFSGTDRPMSPETVATNILDPFESGLLSPAKGTSDAGAKSEATADTPKPEKSTVSMASTRKSLTKDALPRALSRTALKYRTNEWVKHASVADTPALDPIHIAEYAEDEQPSPTKGEAPAPVVVEELQQTAETGAPAPALSRTATAMSNYDRSLSRSDSRLSIPGKLSPSISPDYGRDSPNATSPVGQGRNASGRRSTSAMHNVQPIYEEDDQLSHSPSPEEDDSGPSSKAPSPPPPQDYRSPPPGIVSFTSPQTLIGQREMFLRNKTQGNVPYGVDYSLPLDPTPSEAGSVYNYPAYGYQPASPGDDIPLSQRKALMRQSSLLASSTSLSRPTSALAVPHQSAETLPFDSHQPARKSNLPTPAARQAQLASFRQSVQADLRAGTPVIPPGNGRETPFMQFGTSTTNLLPGQVGPGVSGLGMTRESEVQRSIDYQRAALLREKEAEAQARETEKWEKERNDKAFEQRMRSGPGLLEAHREAMRRMQGGAK